MKYNFMQDELTLKEIMKILNLTQGWQWLQMRDQLNHSIKISRVAQRGKIRE